MSENGTIQLKGVKRIDEDTLDPDLNGNTLQYEKYSSQEKQKFRPFHNDKIPKAQKKWV